MSVAATRERSDVASAGEGFRDLVVQVDDDPGAAGRLAFAAGFARRQGAHLVAVLAQTPLNLPGSVRLKAGDMLIEAWRRQAADAAKAFADRVAAAGRAEGIEIEQRVVEGFPDETMMEHARYADLTIIGQAADDSADGQMRTIEAVLFGSGRPILLVPSIGRYAAAPRHVLCAWNGSREATRAIADAMPLLRMADRVTVLGADPVVAGRRIPGADISLHLARHGVKVSSKTTYAGDLPIGDALLNRAADLSADLLVMGGYGHSRTREAIFGGVTRHVLDHMTLPVLMSH